MNNTPPIPSAIVYCLGIVACLAVQLIATRPKLWRVGLAEHHDVQPGKDVLVPVGNQGETRRMRVVSMISATECLAVDIADQQHKNSLAILVSLAWGITLPMAIVYAVWAALASHTNRQAVKSAMQYPRPRGGTETERVPECMQGIEWKN